MQEEESREERVVLAYSFQTCSNVKYPALSTRKDASFKLKEVSKFMLILDYKVLSFKGQQKAKIQNKNTTLFLY